MLRLDDPLDVAVGVADDAAVAGRGRRSSTVMTVATAPARTVAFRGARAIVSAVMSGWSPERTTTSLDVADRVERGAHRAAGAVRLGLDDGLGARSGRPGVRSWLGETITRTRPAPASRAARTGQAIIGLPHTACRTLGSEERMRVPSPAAMIRTVGACSGGGHGGIVEREGLDRGRRTYTEANWCSRLIGKPLAFGARKRRFESGLPGLTTPRRACAPCRPPRPAPSPGRAVARCPARASP